MVILPLKPEKSESEDVIAVWLALKLQVKGTIWGLAESHLVGPSSWDPVPSLLKLSILSFSQSLMVPWGNANAIVPLLSEPTPAVSYFQEACVIRVIAEGVEVLFFLQDPARMKQAERKDRKYIKDAFIDVNLCVISLTGERAFYCVNLQIYLKIY
jgi:hypothetical protein